MFRLFNIRVLFIVCILLLLVGICCWAGSPYFLGIHGGINSEDGSNPDSLKFPAAYMVIKDLKADLVKANAKLPLVTESPADSPYTDFHCEDLGDMHLHSFSSYVKNWLNGTSVIHLWNHQSNGDPTETPDRCDDAGNAVPNFTWIWDGDGVTSDTTEFKKYIKYSTSFADDDSLHELDAGVNFAYSENLYEFALVFIEAMRDSFTINNWGIENEMEDNWRGQSNGGFPHPDSMVNPTMAEWIDIADNVSDEYLQNYVTLLVALESLHNENNQKYQYTRMYPGAMSSNSLGMYTVREMLLGEDCDTTLIKRALNFANMYYATSGCKTLKDNFGMSNVNCWNGSSYVDNVKNWSAADSSSRVDFLWDFGMECDNGDIVDSAENLHAVYYHYFWRSIVDSLAAHPDEFPGLDVHFYQNWALMDTVIACLGEKLTSPEYMFFFSELGNRERQEELHCWKCDKDSFYVTGLDGDDVVVTDPDSIPLTQAAELVKKVFCAMDTSSLGKIRGVLWYPFMTPSWGGTDKCGLVGNVATDEDSAHVIEQANMFPCEKYSAYHAYRWAATMFDHSYKQNRMFTNALRDSTNYDIEETYEDSLGLKSFGYVSSNGALADKNIAVMWHYFPDDFYYGEHLSSVDVELQNIGIVQKVPPERFS